MEIKYRMSLPFSLDLEKGGRLECQEAARILPGRRLVCRCSWDGQTVFAKLFTGSRAERDWQRDQNGSAAMHMRGIRTAKLLHSERLQDGFVLIYEAIEPSRNVADFYAQSDNNGKRALREQCVNAVAQLHNAGLLHTDLHLDNFLLCDGDLYVIDAGSIRYDEKPLSRKDAEANLAVLLAQFALLEYNEVDSLYGLYLGERELESSNEQVKSFRQCLQSARDYRQRKFLEKIFRDCTAFVAEKKMDRRLAFDRSYDSDAFRYFIADPDKFMKTDEAVLLKQGNTSTVAELDCCDKRLVIKRYNVKHLWHGARRMLRMTRAANSWRNAHRLAMLDIPTAKPVAFIENRFGPLRGSSYFIMEAVSGTRADHYFIDSNVPLQIRQGHADVLLYLFERLAAARLVHGDFKASNFMITDHGPVLLDLDAMKSAATDAALKAGLAKDLRRFMKNWQGQAEAEALFAEGIGRLAESYGIALNLRASL